MINVYDIAYIRLRVPDLDKMETFLSDFGMHKSARTDNALYMRGTDPDHHVHVSEQGDPGFIGMAFNAASEEDLHKLASVDGASDVENIDEPGGGQRVRIADPDGLQIELVWGIETLKPLELKEVFEFNSGRERRRVGPIVRSKPRPSQIKRIGHIVLSCNDFAGCDRFYHDTLGMLTSDLLHDDDDENVAKAHFLRCNRGQEYTDHHTVLITDRGTAELGHVAFEVEDWNDLMVGHYHLEGKEYEHRNGIGRHILGSQLFDYWTDPWGHAHEHWTDGDLLNEDTETGSYPLHTARDVQWAPGQTH